MFGEDREACYVVLRVPQSNRPIRASNRKKSTVRREGGGVVVLEVAIDLTPLDNECEALPVRCMLAALPQYTRRLLGLEVWDDTDHY